MGITKVVEPGSVIESRGLDHEFIPFPLPYGPSEHPWIGIFGQFAAVGPDDAVHVMAIKELEGTAWSLNELEITRIIFQDQQSWNAQRIAVSHRIVAQCRRYRARAIA